MTNVTKTDSNPTIGWPGMGHDGISFLVSPKSESAARCEAGEECS